jgi:hypothetical protein
MLHQMVLAVKRVTLVGITMTSMVVMLIEVCRARIQRITECTVFFFFLSLWRIQYPHEGRNTMPPRSDGGTSHAEQNHICF